MQLVVGKKGRNKQDHFLRFKSETKWTGLAQLLLTLTDEN